MATVEPSVCERHGTAATPRRRIPLAARLALAISALVLSVMGALGAVLLMEQERLFHDQQERLARAMARQLAGAVKEPLLAGDTLVVGVALRNVVTGAGDVIGAAVLAPGGKVIVAEGAQPPALATLRPGDVARWRDPAADHERLSVLEAVRFRGLTVGHTLVTLSGAALAEARRRALASVIGATAVFLAVGIAAAAALGRRLSRPIRTLMAASRAIDAGHYRYRIPERRNDEIGELMTAFNRMAEGLLRKEQVETALARYLSPRVARRVLDDLEGVHIGGRRVEGSVLFADMAGYTALSERLPPEDVAEILNRYYEPIAALCARFGGTVDKYIGDCAMVVFGVPEPDPGHRLQAVCAAWAVQEAVARIHRRQTARGEPGVRFRIGLHTGTMLAGNLGSRERLEYTVVGDTVNLAARLCRYAEPGTVVLSEALATAPEVAEAVRLAAHRAIEVRGRRAPVTVYRLDGLRGAALHTVIRAVDEVLGRAP